MQSERINERTRRFYFNTGVRPENISNFPYEYHKKVGNVIRGTLCIPFECDDVPDGAEFVCCADNLEQYEHGFIIAEVRNTSMVSKYAIFKNPVHYPEVHHEAEVLADSYKAVCEEISDCRKNERYDSCDRCRAHNSWNVCKLKNRAESLFTVLQRINPVDPPLPF